MSTVPATLPKPRRGDVFKARLNDVEGSEQAGTRPVVVLTRDIINASSPVVVVVPITDAANPKAKYPSHVFLKKGAGGLEIDSIAKAEQIRAIQTARFVHHYGKLDDVYIAQIEQAIKHTLALR
jgi:mRNA interferase MazF